MRLASSMRYGGMLVEPTDCDYNSFRNLGLICPNCKRSVFLVEATVREPHDRKKKDGTTTKVSEAKVPAYFSHHPDVSSTTVEVCELRVRNISETERVAIASKARHQRLKILQRHLWKMMQASMKFAGMGFPIDEQIEHGKRLWMAAAGAGTIRSDMAALSLWDTLIELLLNQFISPKQLTNTIETFTEQTMDKWLKGAVRSFPSELMRPTVELMSRRIDAKMQVKITGEVLQFLTQKKQLSILQTLIEHSVLCWVSAEAASSRAQNPSILNRIQNYNDPFVGENLFRQEMERRTIQSLRSLIGINRQRFESIFCFVRDDIVMTLAFVDWANQFQLLEKT